MNISVEDNETPFSIQKNYFYFILKNLYLDSLLGKNRKTKPTKNNVVTIAPDWLAGLFIECQKVH